MHLFDAHPERIFERIILVLIQKEKIEFDDTVTVKERERYCSKESNWKGS